MLRVDTNASNLVMVQTDNSTPQILNQQRHGTAVVWEGIAGCDWACWVGVRRVLVDWTRAEQVGDLATQVRGLGRWRFRAQASWQSWSQGWAYKMARTIWGGLSEECDGASAGGWQARSC